MRQFFPVMIKENGIKRILDFKNEVCKKTPIFEKMKILTNILVLYLFSSCLTFAQSADNTIDNIRDSIDSYDTTMVKFWDESSEGGQMIAFFDKDDLKLMEVRLYGETGKRKIEYYFDNGQLFFVLNTDYRYNRPFYWDEEKAKENNDTEYFDPNKTVINENRYYFENKRIIRWIKPNGEETNNKIEDYENLEIEILQYADKMKEKLKNH
jgi:hypothetical protein